MGVDLQGSVLSYRERVIPSLGEGRIRKRWASPQENTESSRDVRRDEMQTSGGDDVVRCNSAGKIRDE